MKLQTRIKIILVLFTIFISIFAVKCLAVSISVRPSVSSIEPGKTFSVTVSGNDATGRVNISVTGGTASTSSIWIESNSQTVSITAGASGTVKINASGELSNDVGDTDKYVTASASVTIIEPKQETSDPAVVDTKPAQNPGNTSAQKPAPTKASEEKKSSEASLKELIVEQGNITPEFSTDITEYTLTVPNEITALNITATPADDKANVTIEGNEDFIGGENKVTIKVIAEDGTTKVDIVNVTRKRTNLALLTLKVTYTDKDGNIQELELNPKFDASILEYNIGEISYLINSLNIEAIANIEGAVIEITGNENLQEGENKIIIKLTMKAEPAGEGEEQEEDEVIIYTINLNKEKEPSFIEKVKDKIKGIFGGISTWYNNNQKPIVICSPCACLVFLLGLSVYIVADYQKYNKLVEKLVKLERINSKEPVKVVQSQEKNIFEENNNEEIRENKQKSGKHFLINFKY